MNSTEDDSVLFWTFNNQSISLVYLLVNLTMFIIGVFVIFLNALVFYTMTKENFNDDEADNYIIANLAVTDMLTGVFIIDTVFYNMINFQSQVECHLRLGFVHFFCQSSVMHLVLLTVDRYVKIIYPYKYHIIFKRNRVIFMSTTIWIVSLLYGALPIMGWHKIPLPGAPPCGYIATLSDGYMTLTLVTFFSPSFILNVMYAHIYHVARRHQRAINNLDVGQGHRTFDQKSWRLTKTVIIISGAYICCWTPFGIVVLMWLHGYLDGLASRDISNLIVYTSILAYCNALANPVIYAFKLPVVQKCYRHVFCRKSCACCVACIKAGGDEETSNNNIGFQTALA